MNYEIAMLFNFWVFLKMYIFKVAAFYFVYYLSNQQKFFSCSKCFEEAFFVLAIVALIIEKMYFSYFHDSLC